MAINKSIGYIICESTTSAKHDVLTSARENRVKVGVTLQETDVFNRNGRRYFNKFLAPALKAPHIIELMRKKSWCGECGHPVKPDLERQLTILPDRTSHRILSLDFRGNLIKGVCEAMHSPLGDIYQNYILQELESAYSLRALGPIRDVPGGKDVLGPMRVVTYDWVFLPSHENAYQDEIISTVTEGAGRKSINTLSESLILPVNQNQAIDYIKDKSKNLSFVSEVFEFAYEELKLSDDGKKIILKEHNNPDTIVVYLEDQLSHEINRYMSNL